MSEALTQRVASLIGATSATRAGRIQSLWSGYGEVVRYELVGAEMSSVVVKHVKPGEGRGRSHDRKLRSYEVEQAWYEQWAHRCGDSCRVARCYHAERSKGEWLFILEDLDAAGFRLRRNRLSRLQLDVSLRWLASFHATFLGQRPRGLWKTGTYWHLKTRPDEHRAMARGPLRDAADAIDARLRNARFLSVVHGDAKPSNFCFAADGRSVAAVDFQYVGGGCGMKDVAYFLAGEQRDTVRRGLEVYFGALREQLHGRRGDVDMDSLESEWRVLYQWAWADFHRFMAGWEPRWRVADHEMAATKKVLQEIRR